MIKNNTIIISIITIAICGGFLASSDVIAVSSWDSDSTQAEHNTWNQELNRWSDISGDWYKKVQSNQYMPSKAYTEPENGCDGDKCWEITPTGASYCVSDKCWESDPTTFVIIDFDGNSVEIWKGRCAMSSDWFITDGNKWTCKNGNQTNEFVGQQKERWESVNFGQKLTYINKAGDKWESGNFGQGITFEGVNGDRWESKNFGQGIERIGEDGKKWEGSKYDTEKRF
ncbi:MAG TPA: hypothetical protein EYG99_01345 [Candidatus Pacebacteria bacterium]|nr:hypothetical protein [Candidatus Paceibacterota bacterium]